MSAEVQSIAEEAWWRDNLERFPQADLYFCPSYLGASELMEKGRALAYSAREGDAALFYPFLLHPISSQAGGSGRSDIQTSYGYGGPLATTSDPAILKRLWGPFSEWTASEGVVAEFTRFHPLLETDRQAAPDMRIAVNRETVVLDLLPESSEEDLWKSYSRAYRNHVRKALNVGLSVTRTQSPSDREIFESLYEQTMRDLDAASSYFFNRDYFRRLWDRLEKQLEIVLVRDGAKPVAAGLFAYSGDFAHYLLSGSDREAMPKCGNNLMLHDAALSARQHGCRLLHLGGGTDDGAR